MAKRTVKDQRKGDRHARRVPIKITPAEHAALVELARRQGAQLLAVVRGILHPALEAAGLWPPPLGDEPGQSGQPCQSGQPAPTPPPT